MQFASPKIRAKPVHPLRVIKEKSRKVHNRARRSSFARHWHCHQSLRMSNILLPVACFRTSILVFFFHHKSFVWDSSEHDCGLFWCFFFVTPKGWRGFARDVCGANGVGTHILWANWKILSRRAASNGNWTCKLVQEVPCWYPSDSIFPIEMDLRRNWKSWLDRRRGVGDNASTS